MKNILFASTAALALAACGANEVEVAEIESTPMERQVVLSDIETADTLDMTFMEIEPVATFALSEFLNAGVIGSDGEKFTDVEDVFVKNGRIQGISFDADAAFGGKRYAEFASLRVVEDDDVFDDDLNVIIPRTEDSFDDFDIIDENVELTFGDAGTDLLEADVTMAGSTEMAEIEDIWFNSNGTVAYYMVDTGVLDAPQKAMPGLVSLVNYDGLTSAADMTLEERTEVLGEVEYDDADAYTYESTDYDPDRK